MAREKILVVDDEKSIRDVFLAAFFDEYKIIPAASGQEALNILNRPNDIDLVVLDVMMPGMTGTQLLREIKKIDPDQKVVLLTGCSSEELAIEALRLGADEYMEKPFDIEKIRAVFERLLSERKGYAEEGTGNIEGKIGQAQRFIRRNYSQPVSLRDVSREVFLSPKYFSRLFKEKAGRSFNEYKMDLKIEMAKELLKKGSHTISQIAYHTGYQNPESFMKMFKKVTGSTPSQYRRRNKKRRNKDAQL